MRRYKRGSEKSGREVEERFEEDNADGDVNPNKGEYKVREVKSPSCFTVVC